MRPNNLRNRPLFVPNKTVASVPRVAVLLVAIIVAFSVTLVASGAPSASPSARITAGFANTCVLTSSGAARCWGGNAFGELGNGAKSINPALVPVKVVGLTSGVRAIAAGGQHTCALTSVGKVKCWGHNTLGQLGKGSITPSGRTPVPVDVAGLGSGVRAIAVGGEHACALMSGGGVKCWGADGQGQLGSGSRTLLFGAPVDVAGLASGVTAIGAGDSHTCAVAGGGVKCWGENTFGQLGNGSSGQVLISTVPVDVVGLASGITAISAGRGHTCALTSGGGVKCWGLNMYGQLGNGSRTTSTTPVNVAGLSSGVSAITTGFQHSCALMRSGGVKCWGSNYGRLGNGSMKEFSTKPVDVR